MGAVAEEATREESADWLSNADDIFIYHSGVPLAPLRDLRVLALKLRWHGWIWKRLSEATFDTHVADSLSNDIGLDGKSQQVFVQTSKQIAAGFSPLLEWGSRKLDKNGHLEKKSESVIALLPATYCDGHTTFLSEVVLYLPNH